MCAFQSVYTLLYVPFNYIGHKDEYDLPGEYPDSICQRKSTMSLAEPSEK